MEVPLNLCICGVATAKMFSLIDVASIFAHKLSIVADSVRLKMVHIRYIVIIGKQPEINADEGLEYEAYLIEKNDFFRL